MILSFSFSDTKNDLDEILNQKENNITISAEIKENLNENMNKERRVNYKDGLLYDENRGNIVEMIFYPNAFDLCKA